MSFFDEPEETRTPPRTAPRRRRPAGGGRRRTPTPNRQAIRVRRLVAAVVVVVAIVLIAVGVHSCQVSARNTSLRNYNNNVASLNARSVNTGGSFFRLLSSGANQPTGLQNQLNQAVSDASSQLSQARGMNVPAEVKSAQQYFTQALQFRHDGMQNIAAEVGPALQPQTSKDAVNTIAANTARFYASDVLYKDYAIPTLLGALHAAGIHNVQVNSSQFLPSIQWLQPDYIASQLHVNLPTPQRTRVAPGLHGHKLNSVSVAATTLQTGSTNTLPASPPATFTLNFTNSGQNTENNVRCKVSVSGSSVSGQTTVPQTTAGQTTSCQVTLSRAAPKGSQTVVATIEPVPGEKTTSNNTLSYPVTFQ